MAKNARFPILPVALLVLLSLAGATTATCLVSCAACQLCVNSSCVDNCNTSFTGLACNATAATCTNVCNSLQCEVWSYAAQACIPGCTGCSSCNSSGSCATDNSLQNECGLCPGEPNFASCCPVNASLAILGTIGINGTSLERWISDLECIKRELVRTHTVVNNTVQPYPCSVLEDCAPVASCDPCDPIVCSDGACVHQPLNVTSPLFDPRRCGTYASYALIVPLGQDPCDDLNDCTWDSTLAGYCTHQINVLCYNRTVF